jgi:hypothetical protein
LAFFLVDFFAVFFFVFLAAITGSSVCGVVLVRPSLRHRTPIAVRGVCRKFDG